MRPVTRNFLLALGVIAVLLLALGALPSYLKSGSPYYLTATPTEPTANDTAVDAANISSQRFPYTTEALANATANDTGRSSPYWRGPVGFKGAFTHSPFDEFDALRQQHPAATTGDSILVRDDEVFYRLTVIQEP